MSAPKNIALKVVGEAAKQTRQFGGIKGLVFGQARALDNGRVTLLGSNVFKVAAGGQYNRTLSNVVKLGNSGFKEAVKGVGSAALIG
ncbi:MAG: hypothetical protein AB7G08_31455, partial [Hyphomicrobiaceae bacterium]